MTKPIRGQTDACRLRSAEDFRDKKDFIYIIIAQWDRGNESDGRRRTIGCAGGNGSSIIIITLVSSSRSSGILLLMSALDDSKVDDRRNSRVKRRNSGGSISHLLSFWKSVEKKNKPVKTPLPSLRRRKWKPPKKKDNPQRVVSPKQNQTSSPQIRTNFDVTVTHEDGEATAVLRKQRPPEEEKQSDSTRSSSVKCIVTEKGQRSPPSVSSSYLMDDEDCLAVFGLDNDEDEDQEENQEEEEEDDEEGEEEEEINNASGNRHKDAKAAATGDEVGKRSSSSSSSSSSSKKMSTKRQKVEAEIISSEEVYVKNLNELIKHFIHPLKSNQELLDPEDILKLFSNIELLCGFHVVFLADLKKKDKEIHLTFQRMADFLKMYTQYVNSYDVAMTTMHRLNKKKKFKAFLDKQQAAAAQGLMSFLIMPVQRIPRYVLLLKELIKNTNDDDQTKEPLRQSLTKVQDIAAYVNEQKRQMESRTTLLNISARLRNVGHFELFKPDRHLVKKGVLHSWHHRLTKQKQHHFMLFTDVVLWTSPRYSGFEQLKLDQVSVNLSKSSSISAISNNSTRSSSSSSSSSISLANNPCTRESSTMENSAIRRGRSHSSRGDDDAISNSHTEEGMNITKEEEGQREFGFRLHIPSSKCRSTFGIGLLRFKEEKPPTFFG
eukprot:jgi/Bigna1/145246/aug1.96_g19954